MPKWQFDLLVLHNCVPLTVVHWRPVGSYPHCSCARLETILGMGVSPTTRRCFERKRNPSRHRRPKHRLQPLLRHRRSAGAGINYLEITTRESGCFLRLEPTRLIAASQMCIPPHSASKPLIALRRELVRKQRAVSLNGFNACCCVWSMLLSCLCNVPLVGVAVIIKGHVVILALLTTIKHVIH